MVLFSPVAARKPDFEVEYRFYSFEEGGRKQLPLQGIYKCNWAYEDDGPDCQHTIWPEFLNNDGGILNADEIALPQGRANMWIVFEETRQDHAEHALLNKRGYFMEGPHKVAECRVVRAFRPTLDSTSNNT